MEESSKTATLTKLHRSNLMALVREYHDVLESYFGDRGKEVVESWYAQERERFEYPDGPEAGRARILDFVPILTRRAVEERIRRLLEGSGGSAFEGAA